MRSYDVVVFGASGFTGRQAARYLANHAPSGLRWAIAGRNATRLRSLALNTDIIVADSNDQASIDAMASATRLVINTAGPFARYATPVVDACVRLHTNYVDITGETFWVDELVSRYHERAAAAGVRIVPCCGFDSVPSDLGTFLLARHRGAVHVRGYFQFGGGGLNGGTIASVANIVETRRARNLTRGDAMSGPHFDKWIGTWVGPFFMAPTNTWVVRRSARLFADWGEPYANTFTYREFLKFDPPLAAAKSIAASGAIAAFGVGMQLPPLFRLMRRFMPAPGEGPSDAQMDGGWFAYDVIGETAGAARVSARIANQGDAGNRSTVKMLCESALCVALGQCTSRGGVLTPATAFGDPLLQRLRTAGMAISMFGP